MKLTYTVVLGPAGWPKSVTAHDERFGDIISTCVHTGRLVTCTSKDAEGGPILETVRYTLDASNRVVEMTRGAGNTSERHRWVYDRQGNWTTSTLITPSATQAIRRVITY
nr:hypothetical protein D3W47_13825 [Deinococcus sp. RM]